MTPSFVVQVGEGSGAVALRKQAPTTVLDQTAALQAARSQGTLVASAKQCSP